MKQINNQASLRPRQPDDFSSVQEPTDFDFPPPPTEAELHPQETHHQQAQVLPQTPAHLGATTHLGAPAHLEPPAQHGVPAHHGAPAPFDSFLPHGVPATIDIPAPHGSQALQTQAHHGAPPTIVLVNHATSIPRELLTKKAQFTIMEDFNMISNDEAIDYCLAGLDILLHNLCKDPKCIFKRQYDNKVHYIWRLNIQAKQQWLEIFRQLYIFMRRIGATHEKLCVWEPIVLLKEPIIDDMWKIITTSINLAKWIPTSLNPAKWIKPNDFPLCLRLSHLFHIDVKCQLSWICESVKNRCLHNITIVKAHFLRKVRQILTLDLQQQTDWIKSILQYLERVPNPCCAGNSCILILIALTPRPINFGLVSSREIGTMTSLPSSVYSQPTENVNSIGIQVAMESNVKDSFDQDQVNDSLKKINQTSKDNQGTEDTIHQSTQTDNSEDGLEQDTEVDNDETNNYEDVSFQKEESVPETDIVVTKQCHQALNEKSNGNKNGYPHVNKLAHVQENLEEADPKPNRNKAILDIVNALKGLNTKKSLPSTTISSL